MNGIEDMKASYVDLRPETRIGSRPQPCVTCLVDVPLTEVIRQYHEYCEVTKAVMAAATAQIFGCMGPHRIRIVLGVEQGRDDEELLYDITKWASSMGLSDALRAFLDETDRSLKRMSAT